MTSRTSEGADGGRCAPKSALPPPRGTRAATPAHQQPGIERRAVARAAARAGSDARAEAVAASRRPHTGERTDAPRVRALAMAPPAACRAQASSPSAQRPGHRGSPSQKVSRYRYCGTAIGARGRCQKARIDYLQALAMRRGTLLPLPDPNPVPAPPAPPRRMVMQPRPGPRWRPGRPRGVEARETRRCAT